MKKPKSPPLNPKKLKDQSFQQFFNHILDNLKDEKGKKTLKKKDERLTVKSFLFNDIKLPKK
jgi:hypothetical protein